MKAPLNRIFVTVEKKFEDEIKLESLTLYKDTSFNPEWNVKCHGTVQSIPLRVETKFAEPDFQVNVLPGDKLYFNYQTLLDDENCIIHEGKEYWAVEYYNAIATVRDGVVYPVGSHILIEPITEEVTSSILIIPDNAKTVEGNQGKVWASNDPDIPKGSIVQYDPVGQFENQIEGTKVYAMYNSNIYFKYN